MAKEEIIEMRRAKETPEIIELTKEKTDDFLRANIPTGRELTLEEKKMYFRKKGFSRITISIKSESGDAEMSAVVDEFNLHLDTRKHIDNVALIKKKLETIGPLVEQLVSNWEREI